MECADDRLLYMQIVKSISNIIAPIIAVTAPSKTYNDLTPPIVEYALLFVPLSIVLSIHFGESVLGSPKNIN